MRISNGVKRKISTIFLLTIIIFGFCSVLFLPSLASAQVTTPEPGWTGLVPCGRNEGTEAEKAPCTLCHLIVGFQRLVEYGMYMVVTLALVGIFFAGVMYMVSTGDEGMMTQAKGFLKVSLIGFAVVVGGWLIVNVTMWILGPKTDLGIGVTAWNKFTCNKTSTQGSGGVNTSTGAMSPSGTTVTVSGCCVIGPQMCGHVSDASKCTNGTYQAKSCSQISTCTATP